MSKNTMPETETAYLDDMDGFGFEQLCERIFHRSNWGDVRRIGNVADGGRDLIINQPDGESIVVECKHQPNSSIGRPIVQKLHSAVISSHAARGIIITTGKYSDEAIQHAKLLSKKTPIELFDRYRLIALAQKAGIKIVIGSHNSTIFCFPASDMVEIRDRISAKIGSFKSHPRTAQELIQIIPNNFTLDAVYVVSAGIHQDFSTSVGRIHSVHEDDIRFIVNAQDGYILQDRESEFLRDTVLTDSTKIPAMTRENKRTNFLLGVTTLKSKATDHIIRKFTAKISYKGRNNVSYTKTCTPGPRSIQINDIKQVFLPRHDLSLNFLKSEYSCLLIQNNHDVMIDSDLYGCKICGEDTEGSVLLCNACGSTAHRPKSFGSHSFICGNCKKTICKNCTFWFRKFLFFKRILCEDCADIKPKSKRKLVKQSQN